MILGVDEVGRGAWAGPLVVGAVVLGDENVPGLADSKLLTRLKREELNAKIIDSDAAIGLGWVPAVKIDEVGLSEALRIAAISAVSQITKPYHEIIIDGTVNFLSDTSKGRFVTNLKKADQLIKSVSAASIVAKVARDNYMHELDGEHPTYGFFSNVGYGTKKHQDAIEKYGVTSEHRRSFKPIKKILGCEDDEEVRRGVSTKMKGDRAETVVCEYLMRLGHKIVERNWRTRFCEIDIVSTYENKVYFTEVKYRRSDTYGGGLEAITRPKLKRMKFAAEMFVKIERMNDFDMLLSVASVDGSDYAISDFMVL
jgi:Ribonuclease HII